MSQLLSMYNSFYNQDLEAIEDAEDTLLEMLLVYQDNDPKCLSKSILAFYNLFSNQDVDSVYNIPVERLEMLLLYNHKELYRPTIIQMLIRKIPWRSIVIRLNVPYNTVQQISRTYLKS